VASSDDAGPGDAEPGDASVCWICRQGRCTESRTNITFRQVTDKGYIFCDVLVPVETCGGCGARHWGDTAEAIIDAAVRREYAKLSGHESAANAMHAAADDRDLMRDCGGAVTSVSE